MIRNLKKTDLPAVMRIWLDANVEAHNFIPASYWISHFEMVRQMLLDAEVYVYEDEVTYELLGFIGFIDRYVAGLFVKQDARSRGVGKMLLNHGKTIKPELHLTVYQKNLRALRFYQREQFEMKAEITDHGTGEKEFVLTWKR